jgi:hypothetical protein
MSVLRQVPLVISAVLAVAVLAGCSVLEARMLGGTPGSIGDMPEPGGDRYPDVIAVELRPAGERLYDVAVTLSSPYDTPERYADGWRVLDPAGVVLGTHTLMHDHASEQPFTRTQRGLAIPPEVDEVTVEGRDQANGFGGLTVTLAVPE